jgi:predicted nucleic acid-binding protein
MSERPVVIDSSVALAIILKEPEAELAVAAMRDWVRTRRERVVPDLFWYEVANVLMRKHGFSSMQAVEAIHQIEQIGLRTVHPERSTLWLAIDRTERHGLTAYDALFLATTETLKADLATLDRSLQRAAAPWVITFEEGHRRNETPAVYEHDVTWPSYARASNYLAELRARARAEATERATAAGRAAPAG